MTVIELNRTVGAGRFLNLVRAAIIGTSTIRKAQAPRDMAG